MSYKRKGRHQLPALQNRPTITRRPSEEALKAALARGIDTGDFGVLRLFASRAQIIRMVREHARNLPTPPRHTYIENWRER